MQIYRFKICWFIRPMIVGEKNCIDDIDIFMLLPHNTNLLRHPIIFISEEKRCSTVSSKSTGSRVTRSCTDHRVFHRNSTLFKEAVIKLTLIVCSDSL